MANDCWFCTDRPADVAPPGGWLVDDGTWRAGHTPASYSIAGTVVLQTRRHVLDPAGFDAPEAATYAVTTGHLVAAIRTVTGCDRVYQWATMDRFAHFHLWLLPWWSSAPSRGPRYLVDTLVDGRGCRPEEADAAAAGLRRVLEGAIR